jgi:hydroxyacylglutathione hydrolase
VHVPLGYLADRATELPRERPIVVQCQSGARSSIAASVLERLGVTNVMNLSGGMSAWVAAGLPVEEGAHGRQATRA